jgi:hypothetical protein
MAPHPARLPLQCEHGTAEVAAAPGQRASCWKKTLAQYGVGHREVAPVVVVADAVQVQGSTPVHQSRGSWCPRPLCCNTQTICPVAQPVIKARCWLQLAFVSQLQVAVLTQSQCRLVMTAGTRWRRDSTMSK